jgi:GntR family transcriptional regulator
MFLPVDPSSGLPVYRQITDQVRRMLVSGRLAPGERLPSIRDLATQLRINPLTVGRAYGDLEREGLIEMRRGLGMYVRQQERLIRPIDGGVPAGVAQAARRLVLEAAQAGLGRVQTVRAVEESWRELKTETAADTSARRSR